MKFKSASISDFLFKSILVNTLNRMGINIQEIYWVYHCNITITNQSTNMKELLNKLKTKNISWFHSYDLEYSFYPKSKELNILSNSEVEFCICLKHISPLLNDTKWYIAIMETGEMFVFLLLDKSGLENKATMPIMLNAFVNLLGVTYEANLTYRIKSELGYFLMGTITDVIERLRKFSFEQMDGDGFRYIEGKDLHANLKLYSYNNTFTAWMKGPFLFDQIETALNDYFVWK